MDPGANFGTRTGGYYGSKLGEIVGGAAQNLVSRFTGFGDYQIKANALMQGGTIENPNTHGGTVYRGTEYLTDIISGDANTFNLQNFFINGGLETTFPKLAQFLANYDQYVIEGMFFEYRTMSCDALNSTNTALGQVVMCTDYNVLNPNFGSKAEMEEYDGGISIKPSESCKFFVECARSESPLDVLYTRTGAIQPGADQRMYDLGNFQIATNGMQASNVNVGELWVTYQVAGLKPKLFTGLGNYNSALFVSNTQATPTNPLGPAVTETIAYISATGVNGWGLGGVSGVDTLFFPISPLKQTYEVVTYWEGDEGAITQPIYVAANGKVVGFPTPGPNFGARSAPNTGEATQHMMTSFLFIAEPSTPLNRSSVQYTAITLPPDITLMNLRAVQIPNNLPIS